jgi:predicted CoA-binding protein
VRDHVEGKEVSMPKIKEAASEFLANKRVAVTGVSREAKGHGSNVVYQRLRERGYEVFAVNRTQTWSKAIRPTATCARFPAASTRS